MTIKRRKHVVLTESTRVLLNTARGKYLTDKPNTKRVTDDLIISVALKSYMGG